TLMIFILGLVNPTFDPLGFGLTGTKGALLFLAIVSSLAGGLFVTGRILFRRAGMGAWLLRRPVLGPCLMCIALHRFSVALRLTSGTGMPIGQAVRLSLRATGSEAFAATEETVVSSLEKGNELTKSLGRAKLFPVEYLDMLSGA